MYHLLTPMPLPTMSSNSSDASSDLNIAGLNNRLARYIDTVRQLELKKGNLTKKLKKVEEFRDSELEERDKERKVVLNELKHRLTQEKDEIEKAKKNCEREVQENMRLVGLVQRQNKGLKTLRTKNDNCTKQFNEQENAVKEIDQENEKMSNEVFRLKDNISKNTEKLESLTIDALQEKKKKEDTESELGIVRKEQNDQKRNTSEIRKETTKRKFRQEIENDKLDIEQHFQKCLKEMRNKAVEELKDDLESIEKFQNRKVNLLENELCSEIGENLKVRENLKDMKRKKEDYSKKLIILEGKCARLEEEIASIENTIQIQQQEQGEELTEKETKISDLKSQLDNLKSSQRKLISDKIEDDGIGRRTYQWIWLIWFCNMKSIVDKQILN